MNTWADLLAEIRTDLKDTSATPKWSDELLYVYVKDAIRDYSLYFPQTIYREPLTAVDGAYPLPPTFIRVVSVECPEDNFLEQRSERPGVRFHSVSQPSRYHMVGSTLYLNGDPGVHGVLLTYEALHAIPASAADLEAVVTIPSTDTELIRLYVKAKVSEHVRTQQSNLDRFKMGAGKRDDNPLQPENDDLMGEYRRKIIERSECGVIFLYRPGRRR